MKLSYVYKELYEGTLIEPGKEGSIFYRKGLNFNNFGLGFNTPELALEHLRELLNNNGWLRYNLNHLYLIQKVVV